MGNIIEGKKSVKIQTQAAKLNREFSDGVRLLAVVQWPSISKRVSRQKLADGRHG